mgnify:CR=1 FL=1
MHFTKKNAGEKRKDFLNNLEEKKLLRFPGAYNPLCAKLIAEIGFDGVYISGGVMSNDLGIPDIGLTEIPQAMPDYCKVPNDPISGYRNYYINEKFYFANWKKREKPLWF